MIRDTAEATRLLRHHGYLCLSRNPGDGDTWTITSDPDEPTSMGARQVAEGLARKLLKAGLVKETDRAGVFTPSLSRPASSAASSPSPSAPDRP